MGFLGCGTDTSQGTTASPLVWADIADPFPPNATIEVCWTTDTIGNHDTQKEWARLAAENSWPMVTRIRFKGWQTCPTTGTQKFIKIHGRAEGRGSTAANGMAALREGQTPESDPSIDFGLDGTRAEVEHVAVHELGHVLGFNHENEHPLLGQANASQLEPMLDQLPGMASCGASTSRPSATPRLTPPRTTPTRS